MASCGSTVCGSNTSPYSDTSMPMAGNSASVAQNAQPAAASPMRSEMMPL
jgi:hypothetical protein